MRDLTARLARLSLITLATKFTANGSSAPNAVQGWTVACWTGAGRNEMWIIYRW